jgi:hypothetical protein
MTCREIEEKFVRYSKHDLSAIEAQAVATHLAECRQCSAEYRLFALKRQLLLATLPEPGAELSPYFYSRLKARLSDIAQVPVPTFWEAVRLFSRSFAVAAFVLLVVMGGINFYLRMSLPEEQSDFVSALAERNLSESERTVFADDKELTSDSVLTALISSNGGQR